MALSNHHADASGHTADWAFKHLFKLESECRSPALAAQVQAVGQFPKLFDQFPFPTLVGPAFLKLGDLFCGSPNSLRYHIAQVFSASQNHLQHITYTEELLRRVLVVLYSNDPIARALALRLVGNASIVFARYPEAQHGVLLRYQSTHPLEIAAAVYATESLLKYSPAFLAVVWETVIAKASDSRILDSVRAQLIRSLRHAAPNLQLSVLLYSHCCDWIDHPDNTLVVKEAALAAWSAVIQPHNELKDRDAERASRFVLHDLESTRRAALALLGTWKPKRPSADIVVSGDVEAADNILDVGSIKERLVEFIRLQLPRLAGDFDFRCTRLAVVALARVEASYGSSGIPESWLFAEALCKWTLHVFSSLGKGDVPMLEYAQVTTTGAGEYRFCGGGVHPNSLRDLNGVAALKLTSTSLRHLVYSTMLVVNIASILRQPGQALLAAAAVASSWKAISYSRECAGFGRYIKRFLEASWIWCRRAGVEDTLLSSFGDILEMTNVHVYDAVIAIALKNQLSDCFVTRCSQAVAKSNHASVLNGMQGLFKVLPTYRFSYEFQEWFDAMAFLADAEGPCENIEHYSDFVDSSLCALRVLDKESLGYMFQIFIIQIRKELVLLLHDWRKRASTHQFHPSLVLIARLLIERARDLEERVKYVIDAFLSIDHTMKHWLERVLATLNTLSTITTNASVASTNLLDSDQGIDAAVVPENPKFTPGPSFFSLPPNPLIDIQTRPSFGSGDGAVVVASASQLHFIVEGFVKFPKHRLPVSMQRVRVVAWLSQRPRQGSDQDLPSCAKYNAVARTARVILAGTPIPANSVVENGYDEHWDTALAFETALDGNYFACPCTISLPRLDSVYGHFDTTLNAHVHIMCALVDSTNRIWWLGPHNSYPLSISTTIKS
ncbi:hypothetical protein H4R26_003688 [Coemansia thaxteri]|uniref:Integrator complex subunit 7 N-terminal domain-containing protein n=1 Tax=Coemansia thaxteri TaxID=2663907 RepID=A0A9W8BAQ8_9FUNG|nr:hypothetical protein H4R26_003688 [Coemansia thaxteri]